MNADDLKPEQLRQLADDAHACRGFYHKLAARMAERGFSQADPLLLLTLDAEKAAAALWGALHYRACGVHLAGSNLAVPRVTEVEPQETKPE